MRYPSTTLATAVQLLVRNHKTHLGIDVHLDHLRLQAVLFMAHVNGLCLTGKSVLADKPYASPDGPIFQAVHDQLHIQGDATIVDVYVRTEGKGKRATFKMPPLRDAYTWRLLETTLETHGTLSKEELIALTRSPAGPWARARAEQLDRISDLLIVSCC